MNCQTEVSTGSDPEIPISLNTEIKQASEKGEQGSYITLLFSLKANFNTATTFYPFLFS